MENKINENPYTIDQIPAKLFNSQFLSDITFIVKDKNIYAHSMQLMLRSSVFQEQLEATLGEKKIIPITAYGYDVFYLFLHFIYTDQLETRDLDWFYLMRLAKEYKVLSLEKHLRNKSLSEIQYFDFCVLDKPKTILKTVNNIANNELFCKFEKIWSSDAFLSLQSDIIKDILKIDEIRDGVSEFLFGDALARWMKHYCDQNQIQLSECRTKFDHFIRLIRFPAMSSEEVRKITIKYPDLLTKSEIANIGAHKIFGAEYDEGIWNCVPRTKFIWPYELKNYTSDFCYTKFRVDSTMILGGFVFGGNEVYDGKRIDATIIYRSDAYIQPLTYNLGTSLRSGVTYLIKWKLKNAINYWSRKPGTSLILNGPPNWN